MIKLILQFFCPLMAVASVIAVYRATSYVFRVYSASDWVAVESKVIDFNKAVVSSSRGEVKFKIKIEYEYFSKGETRIGTRLSFLRNLHSPKSIKTMLGLNEPDVITVWVDPRNPDESVVHKGSLFHAIFIFLISSLVAIIFARLTIALYNW